MTPRATAPAPVIVWFRLDLRLADNPALSQAAQQGPVIPLFIWAPEEEAPWQPGAASNWWLHHSLASLSADLRSIGSRLILRRGPALESLRQLISETGARSVFWNRRYEPAVRQRDEHVAQALQSGGIETRGYNSALLHEPWTVQNKSGKPFQVFTAYWRHCLTLSAPPQPLPRPTELRPARPWPASLPLHELQLEPIPDWAGGLRSSWQPGEAAAWGRLKRFLQTGFAQYAEQRNLPDLNGTSRLSPHLHFGEISPRQIWCALDRAHASPPRHKSEQSGRVSDWRLSSFATELGWREFAHHLLYHFPRTISEPLRPDFKQFRWRTHADWLKAWQHGTTGYPFVDAGMRELWHTGWMHNRVRMVVASFLVKDLLISWREGARWFWDTLVDADLAQNTLGWQWTAGCGADAAPFFRIFNPTLQGEKFDPDGAYIRRWLPELADLPAPLVHNPHRATDAIRSGSPRAPTRTYPKPIVSHTVAREIALEAYNRLRAAPSR